jgi:hypothetical protein
MKLKIKKIENEVIFGGFNCQKGNNKIIKWQFLHVIYSWN